MLKAKLHKTGIGYLGLVAWMFRNIHVPGRFVLDSGGRPLFDADGWAYLEADQESRFSYVCRRENYVVDMQRCEDPRVAT